MKLKLLTFILAFLIILLFSCNKKNNNIENEKQSELFNLAIDYEKKSIEYFKNNDLVNAEACALKFKQNMIDSEKYYNGKNKDYLGSLMKGEAMTILGYIYYSRGEYEKAAEHFNKSWDNCFIAGPKGPRNWYFYLLSLIKAEKVFDNKARLDEFLNPQYPTDAIQMPIFFYTYAKYLFDVYKQQHFDVDNKGLLVTAHKNIIRGIEAYEYNKKGIKEMVTDSKGQSYYEIKMITEFSFEPDVKAEILKQFRLNVSLEEMESLKSEIEKEMKK